ncbi:neogenin-like [Gigantopelta aegis]|uniref:neogenin-like n=1 Tax=Gigantopelta aegis TaxID=1735272 RepID=UPI001B88C521|nr:neogenin-like [Gigantopelta aegis]
MCRNITDIMAVEDGKLTRRAALRVGIMYFCLALVVEAQNVPPAAPARVLVKPTVNSIIVVWASPPADANIPLRGYVLGYGRRRPDVYQMTLDPNAHHSIIHSLQPATQYVISIRAFNSAGHGRAKYMVVTTSEETIYTEYDVPPAIAHLLVEPNADSIEVIWAPPSTPDDILVRGYVLGYGRGRPDVYQLTIDPSTHHYTIRNLQPATEYVISIRSFNNAGQSQVKFETVTTSEETN